MNIKRIKDGPLKEIFDALKEAFRKNNIDFYLIGAQARDQWYAKEKLLARRTNDIDFAAYISNSEDYEAVRSDLIHNHQFHESSTSSFILISKGGIQVDILPFGEIEIDDAMGMKGQGLVNFKVNGFKEIYQHGTVIFQVDTGHEFKIASLPAIVLLKLIAFDDRPEIRSKDASDINSILKHYFDLQSDFIFENHADLFQNTELQEKAIQLPEIAAIVIGREIKKIIHSNEKLLQRITGIIQRFIEAKEKSSFIRIMLAADQSTVEDKCNLLRRLLEGMTSS